MSMRLPQSVVSEISIFWNGDCTSSSVRVMRKPMAEPVWSKFSYCQVGSLMASCDVGPDDGKRPSVADPMRSSAGRDHAIAARILGPVERRVRTGQQVLQAAVGRLQGGDARAGAHRQAVDPRF